MSTELTNNPYKPSDLATMQRILGLHKTANSKSTDQRTYFLPKGTEKAVIRFLPAWEGSVIPAKIVYYHYQLPIDHDKPNPNNKKQQSIICFEQYDLPCGICNLNKEYIHHFDVDNWKAAARAYFNVLVLADLSKSPAIDPNIPYAFWGSLYDFEWLLEQMKDPSVGDILSPTQGSSVSYQRAAAGGKFTRIVARGFTPIAPTPDAIQHILNQMYNFDKVYRTPDDTFMEKMNDVTRLTKSMYENLYMTLSGSGGAKNVTPAINAPVAPRTIASTATLSTGAPVQQAAAKKPPGAPTCYSDAKVYSDAEKKCIMCSYQYACEQEIVKLKGGDGVPF